MPRTSASEPFPPTLHLAAASAGVRLHRWLSSTPTCLALVETPHLTWAVLKTLDDGFSDDDEIREMLCDELRLYRTLRHPRILRLLGGSDTSEPPYLLLEFVPGPDLCTFAAAFQPFPWTWALKIARDILEGLNYLHSALSPSGEPLRIVYRDLKPANLLLDPAGSLRLIDFGLSAFSGMHRQTQTTSLRGTWRYLPPEAFLGIPLQPHSDIFTWGVVVSELLLGQPLLTAKHLDTIAAEILDPAWSYPRGRLPSFLAPVDDLLSSALSRDPSLRPTAHQAETRLRLILDHLGLRDEAIAKEIASSVALFPSAFGDFPS